ncbi:MAG: serine hydrolase domain-containing protein, partial [Alphaproteobacteria bacterium]
FGPETTRSENDSRFRELEKVLLAELKESSTPGAAVAIVSGDRVAYAKGFGIANVETGTPVTSAMCFRAGSINKMLTAAVLVGLAEEGKIALDEPLEKGVHGLAPRLSRLTADQLLSHTAGLIDPARICCAQDESALAAEVRAYRDAEYFFTEPGRIFSYSNTGYIIAGYLIEQLTGERYADAMERRLFGPLGMKHTTLRPTTAMTFALSQGHDADSEGKPTVKRPFVNNVGDWPAGYAYTTVGDLCRFAIALMNGGKIDGKQVLAPSLLTTLSKPWMEVPFDWDIPKGFLEGTQYGHGFFLQKHRGLHILHHGGTIVGFGSFIVLVPEKRFAVVLMANKTGTILGKTAEAAMELFLPLQPKALVPIPEPVPMTKSEMQEIAGTYRNGLLRIELFVRDGQLIRKETYPTTAEEGPGREIETPVKKIGRDRFVFFPPGEDPRAGYAGVTQFTLVRDSKGAPEYVHGSLEAAARESVVEQK